MCKYDPAAFIEMITNQIINENEQNTIQILMSRLGHIARCLLKDESKDEISKQVFLKLMEKTA